MRKRLGSLTESAFRPLVDYSLRPAKAIVRRFIVEAMSRLDSAIPVSQYRYIGMGSIYFRDFQLIHRRLRIDKMISIEGRENARKRVDFNRPLSCIDLLLKPTSSAIPELDLGEAPDFIWLDYESRVDASVLLDIEEIFSTCAPMSAIFVSFNSERLERDATEEWLADTNIRYSSSDLPRLRAEFAAMSYRIVRDAIDNAVQVRNAACHPVNQVDFEQLLHIVYADNLQMSLIGGLVIQKHSRSILQGCRFDDLEYIRHSDDPFHVRFPRLTRREVLHLSRHLPAGGFSAQQEATMIGLKESEVREFETLYRYAPMFVEVDEW